MEKEPVPFPAAGSSRQLKLRQNRELQKSSASIDLQFMKESSDTILELDGKTMDWAPDKNEAFRQLMAKAADMNPQPAARSRKVFPSSMRRLLIAACVASFLVVGAYADINGRLLRNPNEYSFQITAGVSDEPEEITLAGTQSDTPLYKQLEALQIQQPLLPRSDLLDSYKVSLEKLANKIGNSVMVTWKNRKNQVTFEVADYREAEQVSIMKSYPYSRMEEFVNNGVTYALLEYRGQVRCVFHTGDILYSLTADLDWGTVRELARSIC